MMSKNMQTQFVQNIIITETLKKFRRKVSENTANPAQSVRRSPRERSRKRFADFVTSIDSDTSS